MFSSNNKDRIFVFIDASNIWEVQKSKGKNIDYEKLKKYLNLKFSQYDLVYYFYTAYPAEGTRDHSTDGMHRFYTFLKKGLKFIVRKKPLKRIVYKAGETELIREKGNMDVELTIDAVHNVDKYKDAIIFSGDSDFLELVNYMKRDNKKVFVFSSRNNISQELRSAANTYTDILTIQNDIWGKELQHRDSVKK